MVWGRTKKLRNLAICNRHLLTCPTSCGNLFYQSLQGCLFFITLEVWYTWEIQVHVFVLCTTGGLPIVLCFGLDGPVAREYVRLREMFYM